MTDGIMMIFPKPIPWLDDVLDVADSKFIDKIEFRSFTEKEVDKCHIVGKLQGSVVWSGTFGGKVLHLSVEAKLIVLYTTEQHVYLLRLETGQVAHFPLKVDRLAYLQHAGNYLLTINEFGWLQTFKLLPTSFHFKTDLKDLVLGHYQQTAGGTNGAAIKKLQQGVISVEGLSAVHAALKLSFASSISEAGEVRISLDNHTHLLYDQSLSAWHHLQSDLASELMYPTKAFTEWTENMLAASTSEVNKPSTAALGLLGQLEESLALSMQQHNVALFTDLLTHYVLLLATHPHHARLISLLAACVHQAGPEHQFLVKNKIDPQTVVKNIIRLLQVIPHTENLFASLAAQFELGDVNHAN